MKDNRRIEIKAPTLEVAFERLSNEQFVRDEIEKTGIIIPDGRFYGISVTWLGARMVKNLDDYEPVTFFAFNVEWEL